MMDMGKIYHKNSKNINIKNFFKIKNDFYKKLKLFKKKIDELLRREHKRSLRLIILYF